MNQHELLLKYFEIFKERDRGIEELYRNSREQIKKLENTYLQVFNTSDSDDISYNDSEESIPLLNECFDFEKQTLENTKSDVIVAKYDLSKGIIKILSNELFGEHVEGVWHTGIRVFGMEFFYGSYGMLSMLPDEFMESRNIQPTELINMGTTTLTIDEFTQKLDDLKEKFTNSNYHLLENNCNHFTQNVLKILGVNSLPNDILNQHLVISETKIWPLIKPYVENYISSSLV